MITAGIDMGARSVKVALLRDGEIVGRAARIAGFAAPAVARALLDEALAGAGTKLSDLDRSVATGVGRDDAPGRDRVASEVSCAARGACHLVRGARTVIDVGAEEGRAIACDGRGRVLDFAINERCAAGSGAFAEAVARALDVPIEELGPLSLRGAGGVAINTQCVVFAESEVVSLIHSNVEPAEVARAVHEAMASRVAAMARRIGVEQPALLVGGLGLNAGFVSALRRALALDALEVPAEPHLCAALGAALLAADDR